MHTMLPAAWRKQYVSGHYLDTVSNASSVTLTMVAIVAVLQACNAAAQVGSCCQTCITQPDTVIRVSACIPVMGLACARLYEKE
jgi:hypothetical protein